VDSLKKHNILKEKRVLKRFKTWKILLTGQMAQPLKETKDMLLFSPLRY
jgi:hypothetical protein